MHGVQPFNPDRSAALETAGWKAYAARNWPRFLLAMTRLNAEQFHMPLPLAILGSWYLVRASLAWVPADHDEAMVRSSLEQFYRLARRYSRLSFNPERAAECEIRYWDAHRRAVRQTDKQAFTQAMIALHGELFGISPEQARESAELRVEANNVYDPIALGEKAGTDAEWSAVQLLLQRCYRLALREMEASRLQLPA